MVAGLRRRVVGTGCRLGDPPCQRDQWATGQSMPPSARSALFRSGLKGKQVEEAAGAWGRMWVRRRTERDQLPAWS